MERPTTPELIDNAIPKANTDKNVNTDIITLINIDCSLTKENTSGDFFIMRSQYFQIVLIFP